MSDNVITEDELLAEFERLGAATDASQGRTVTEISSETGLSPWAVRRRLRKAGEIGILRTGTRSARTIDGRDVAVPCYWFDRGGESA